MQGIVFNPTTINRFNYNSQRFAIEPDEPSKEQDSASAALGAAILANQNIAFMSKQADEADEKGLPKYDKSLVADEAEGHFSYYLRNNPEEFYIRNGVKINNFLRKGELEPILETEDDVDDIFKNMVAGEVREKKDYNRAIVDSVEILDSMMMDKTTEPMVVYRYAPASWLNTAKDGVVKDDGFFSTTTVKGDMIEDVDSKDRICFEVWIPEGTPYVDLTDRGQYEMLFPRGKEFSVIDSNSLEMLSNE